MEVRVVKTENKYFPRVFSFQLPPVILEPAKSKKRKSCFAAGVRLWEIFLRI